MCFPQSSVLTRSSYGPLYTAITTGFCGSLTTFSSWQLDVFTSWLNPTHAHRDWFRDVSTMGSLYDCSLNLRLGYRWSRQDRLHSLHIPDGSHFRHTSSCCRRAIRTEVTPADSYCTYHTHCARRARLCRRLSCVLPNVPKFPTPGDGRDSICIPWRAHAIPTFHQVESPAVPLPARNVHGERYRDSTHRDLPRTAEHA